MALSMRRRETVPQGGGTAPTGFQEAVVVALGTATAKGGSVRDSRVLIREEVVDFLRSGANSNIPRMGVKKEEHIWTRSNRAEESRAEQSRAEQSTAEQGRAGQRRAEQGRAGQSRPKQARAGKSSAEQSRAEQSKHPCWDGPERTRDRGDSNAEGGAEQSRAARAEQISQSSQNSQPEHPARVVSQSSQHSRAEQNREEPTGRARAVQREEERAQQKAEQSRAEWPIEGKIVPDSTAEA
ncbi:hypothetical protein BDK51DRAFT_28840 [Blyttiomyces helicus]|uniref:Uncharacterized protein n=1 Tax=Blyttiomyces helicus TaxID=388810 RepID=A0A4V1ISD2_9FUNG|nr:hypothetical protein BDK51DRAFT_28840 [Blyttiomyces helicus]|eukprot:RKO93147.1 hypothetical protein BDK51DRAFT_28840 [Blyttiomyces helicus]